MELRAVGVAVPVHDEEALLDSALTSLVGAAEALQPLDIRLRIAVVLDRCSDRSDVVAASYRPKMAASGRDHRLIILETDPTRPGNVGAARHFGLRHVLGVLGVQPGKTWLATTDGDTQVPPSWLTHQIAHGQRGIEAWAGTVTVDDWSNRSAFVRKSFQIGYQLGLAGAGHVHGASLGFTAAAYLRAGGFPPVQTAEDHRLWEAFRANGTKSLQDPTCPVTTSSRRRGRAPHGFANLLNQLERFGPALEAGEGPVWRSAPPGTQTVPDVRF